MLVRPLPVWRAFRSSRHRHYSKPTSKPQSPAVQKSPSYETPSLANVAPKTSSNSAPKAPPNTTPSTPPNSAPRTPSRVAPETPSSAAPKTEPNTASETASDTAPEIPDYHPKVRALPFAFPPEHAIRQAGVTVSIIGYSSSSEHPNVTPSQIVSSILAKYLPITGCKPLQPSRIQALYFPTWLVDAEIEARAWFTYSKSDEEELDDDGGQKGSQSESAIVHVENVYLPGYTMDAGRVLIRDPPKDCDLAQPFTPDLTNQWGQDVMCLPFNTSPFDLIEKARGLWHTDAVIGENTRFIPESVKPNLAAAYPVLLPAYLLQYSSQEPWPPITVIMTAHNNSGIFHLHIPHSDSPDAAKLPFEEYFDGDDFIEGHGPVDNTDAFALVINRGEAQTTEELSAWLSDKLHERGAPIAMASGCARDIKMDDLRVREWTDEEVKSVRNWLETGRAVALVRRWMKQIDEQSSLISSPEAKQAVDALQAFFKAEADKVHKLEELRATQLPRWWPEWEESEIVKQKKQAELFSSVQRMGRPGTNETELHSQSTQIQTRRKTSAKSRIRRET